MLEIIALLCIAGALVILYYLSAIDLRVGLLPNELVMGLLCLGVVFHLSTLYRFAVFEDMALGAFIGGGILYFIRLVAQMIYKEDALGLGDVKLLGAAGVWLGPYHVLLAMTMGALAGLLHGLGLYTVTRIRTKTRLHLRFLSLPAGPGFAVGIVIAGVIKFWNLPEVLFQ